MNTLLSCLLVIIATLLAGIDMVVPPEYKVFGDCTDTVIVTPVIALTVALVNDLYNVDGIVNVQVESKCNVCPSLAVDNVNEDALGIYTDKHIIFLNYTIVQFLFR